MNSADNAILLLTSDSSAPQFRELTWRHLLCGQETVKTTWQLPATEWCVKCLLQPMQHSYLDIKLNLQILENEAHA